MKTFKSEEKDLKRNKVRIMYDELKETNTFIDPRFTFITIDVHHFLTMGDIHDRWQISPYFTFVLFFFIENNKLEIFVTIIDVMGEKTEEFRDPVYNFIHINPEKDYEKNLIDKNPYFQRLRHIHQLGMMYYVYPSARHTRFEHSLGTMEMATKLFDMLQNKRYNDRYVFQELFPKDEIDRYRQILRVACLLHDVGHYPFSHAAESKEIWGKKHEARGVEIVKRDAIKSLIEDHTPKDMNISVNEIIPLIEEEPIITYAPLRILREIIAGDLGVDRIDYLIRDSLHTGVLYGVFDYHRLLDTLLVGLDDFETPRLCLEKGGIHAAEGLILARYYMFLQVYFHRTRVAYDLHLSSYLKEFIPNFKDETGIDYTSLDSFLDLNDFILLTQIQKDSKKNQFAKMISTRQHHIQIAEIDGSRLDPIKVIGKKKKQKEISKMVYKEFKKAIEEDYLDEMEKGIILFGNSETATNKFEKTAFPVYDGKRLRNILDESKLIDNLKSIDLFRVFTNGKRKDIVGEVEKIQDGIETNYYFERKGEESE